jgi:transcriptional regulator with XRE-family HTH domain
VNKKLLRAIRKSGWLLEELAGLIRVPEPILYRILTGITQPDEGTKSRIAAVLDCEVSEIFEAIDYE